MLENDRESLIEALEWQITLGVDENILETPVDRYAAFKAKQDAARQTAMASAGILATNASGTQQTPQQRSDASDTAPLGTAEAVALGQKSVATIKDLAGLRTALETFEGCELSGMATNLVFGDGNPDADIMLIGEAPGAEEDRQGVPFIGASGQLLDRMLSFIGLTREQFYITNTVYWRPPGNRKPNDGEFAVCKPFVEKHIELVAPKLLILVGDKSVRGLAGASQGITRTRGHWYDVTIAGRVIPAMATFHPAYLLRTPTAKRLAWRDLLAVQRRMRELGLN